MRATHIYTIEEFKNIFGISRQTVWRWRKEQIFRTVEINGRIYIPVQEVERLLSIKSYD